MQSKFRSPQPWKFILTFSPAIHPVGAGGNQLKKKTGSALSAALKSQRRKNTNEIPWLMPPKKLSTLPFFFLSRSVVLCWRECWHVSVIAL